MIIASLFSLTTLGSLGALLLFYLAYTNLEKNR